jgi:predicted nucleotidyltransferase
MGETIVWKKKRPSGSCDAILESIAQALRGRVEEAWVFGSFGTDECLADSDCDLLLVCETELPFWQRPRLFDDLYDLFPRLDLLVYTPAESAEADRRPNPFRESVLKSRRRLI